MKRLLPFLLLAFLPSVLWPATERLEPDAILSSTNLNGTVSDIQGDPFRIVWPTPPAK